MTAHQTWTEWQEVPFAFGCLDYSFDVDAQFVKYKCELVNEGDVQIALVVRYNLGNLCDLDTFSQVRARDDYFVLERAHQLGNLGSRA